jgi:hypothetical protein
MNEWMDAYTLWYLNSGFSTDEKTSVSDFCKIHFSTVLFTSHPQEARPIRRSRHRCEDSIIMDLKGSEAINWFLLAQDKVQ